MNKSFTVCLFGTYDRNYSRNQILITGLERNNASFSEVHVGLEQKILYSQKHIGLLSTVYRLLRKAKFFPVLFKNIPTIYKSDVIFVPYPGHVDIVLGYITAKVFNKPIIFDPIFSLYQVFTSDFRIVKTDSLYARLLKTLEKILFSLPNIILADTEFQKEYYYKELHIPRNKIKVLPIGADDEIYKKLERSHDQKEFNVVYYGLYNPTHGVEYILEAAKALQDKKDIHFLMVGNGQTYPASREYAKLNNLQNVHFYPEMKEKDATETISKADVFLGLFQDSPTVFRAIPNKVFQGLALNKTVLTADSPPIRSTFVHKETIYTVKVADSKALVKAILELRNNPKLNKYIAQNGYLLFKNSFTPEAIGKRMEEIVYEAINKSKN